MRRTTASVPLLALVVVALAACGPTPPPGDSPSSPRPDPRPTPPATATPIPVPEPTETLSPEALDPLDAVTRILIQTESLYFCDDLACGVDGFRYGNPADQAVAKLTAAFDAEPTVESYEGYAGSTSYAYWWTRDFLLYFSAGGSAEVDHTLRVQVGAASIHGVTVEAEHGVRVGTPMSAAVAAAEYSGTMVAEVETLEAHFGVIGTAGEAWTAIIASGDPAPGARVSSIFGPIRTQGPLG